MNTNKVSVKCVQDNELFWQEFYTATRKQEFLEKPSSFCLFLIENNFINVSNLNDTNNRMSLVDIGCGNGRDTFYFAHHLSLNVTGVDSCSKVIDFNKAKAKANETNNVDFIQMNVNNAESLTQFKQYDFIYARFFLHSITQEDQSVFMRFLGEQLKASSFVFLEFRTDKDPMKKKSILLSTNEGISQDAEGHYRRYINFNEFCGELKRLKFEIVFAEEKDGLSIRGEDNPFLARIVAKKI
jgi:tellurite methyltransferase